MATALAGQITYDQYGQPYDGWGNKIPGTLIPGGEGVQPKFIPTEGTIKQAGESGKDQYIPSRALTPAEQKIMAAGGQLAGGIKLDENGRMPDVGQGTLSGFWIMPNGSIAADPTQVDSHWGLQAGPNGYANFNGDWSKMVSLGSDLARAIHHGDDSFLGNVVSPALKFAGLAGTLSGFGGKFLDSAANSLLGNATNGTGNLLGQFFSGGGFGGGGGGGLEDVFSGMGSSETLTAEQLKALYQSMGMNPTDAAAAAASVFGEQGSSSLLDLLGKVPPIPPIPPKDNPEAPADGQAPPPPPPPPNNPFDPTGRNSNGPSGQGNGDIPTSPNSPGTGPINPSMVGLPAQTALQKLLSGQQLTTADYISLAGTGLQTGLGLYGADQARSNANTMFDKFFGAGAPSRSRFEASFAPGFTMASDPGYTDALNQSSKSILHGLSVNGNPAQSPNAWAQGQTDLFQKTAYPALNSYRNINATAGGLGASDTAAAAGLSNSVLNAQNGAANVVGAGAADIFTPRSSLADLLKQFGGSGLSANYSA